MGKQTELSENPSLRVLIMEILLSMSLVFLLTLSLLMAAEFTTLKSLSATVEKASIFVGFSQNYSSLLGRMRSWYYSSSQEDWNRVLKEIQGCEESCQDMERVLTSPRFTDQVYLLQSLLDVIRECKESEDSRVTLYARCRQIGEYLEENETELHSLLASEVSDAYSLQYGRTMRLNSFLILLILILGCILFIFSSRMVDSLVRPLMRLTQQVRQFTEEDFSSAFSPATEAVAYPVAETNILTASFQEMGMTIKAQMDQLREKLALEKQMHALSVSNMQMKVSLTETKMQLIQSMISPHFLFNCLGTLAAMAYFEKAPKTRAASLEISEYLRESLSFVGRTVTVSQEMEHTLHYENIQKLRFGDRLCFLNEVEEGCEKEMIPGMLLQPLVENSISHGAKEKEDEIWISIRIFRRDGSLFFVVEDNGDGMSPERLSMVREEIASPFTPGIHSVGLHGVADRIRASFPERGSVLIESEEGLYTRITIQIRDYSA